MDIKKWLGLKNTTAPERLKPGELSVAQNVDIDDAFKLLARTGYVIVQNGSYHSLWADGDQCYVMVAQDLKRMSEDGSLTQVTRLTSGRPVSYAELNSKVYFTNGADTGRIVNYSLHEWGIRPPKSQPQAVAYIGALPPGKYMYAMTFARSDGLESGTGLAGTIELETSGGILFSGLEISTDPDIAGKLIYLSTANGTELYLAGVIPAYATTYTYMNDGSDLLVTLSTQFVEPAPAGHLIEIHNGVAYVVVGNVVHYSDAHNVEYFRPSAFRFLQFMGRVTLFTSVGDGIYVATEKGTWYLDGSDPTGLKSVQVLGYGAIEGTAVKFNSEELESDEEVTGTSRTKVTKPAVMWASPYGIMVGLSGGQVKNLTDTKYGFPSAQRGAGLLRASRGFTQYVATLQGTGVTPNIYE